MKTPSRSRQATLSRIVIISIAALFLQHAPDAGAQVTLSGTSYTQNFDSIGSGLPTGWSVRTNATSTSLGGTATFTTAATSWAFTTGGFYNCASTTNNSGTAATGSEAATPTQSGFTDRCIAVKQSGSFGDPGAAFVIQIANTLGLANFQLSFDCNMLNEQGRSTTWTVDYGIGSNPTTFTSTGVTYADPGVFGTTVKTVNFGNALDNQSGNVWIRVIALTASSGSSSRDMFGIDNFNLTFVPLTVGSATQVRVETAPDDHGSLVSSQSIAAGVPLTVYAVARDANGFFVSNAAPTWVLSTANGGVVSTNLVVSATNSATFTGGVIGTAVIRATNSGLTSVDSGTITVTHGNTAYAASIETLANGSGTVVVPQTVATGNSFTMYAVRRDLYGNFIDNLADQFSITNKTGAVADSDLVQNPSVSPTSATFTASGVGVASIQLLSGTLSASVALTAAQVAPTITSQPQSINTNAGVNVSFSVAATGSQPFTYQWRKDGNNIANATNSTLTLNAIANSDIGSYDVVVANGVNPSATSTAATLTVKANAFTLMTYNVKGNFSANWDISHPQVQALGRQLQYLQPDIITFNEIPNGSNATLNAIISTYLPGYTSTQTDAATDGGIRSAIVTHYPIVSSNSYFHNLDLTPYGSTNTYTRDLYVAEIQVPGMGKPVYVGTTHLKSNSDPQSESCKRRAAEANVVSNFFYNFQITNTTHDYFLVTGDWNQDISNNDVCDPTNKPADSITASNFTGLYLTTPVDTNAPGATTNYFTHSIQGTLAHRYDYIAPCGILYSNIYSARVFRTSTLPSLTGTGLNANDDATTSDHLPVIVSFNNPDSSAPSMVVAPTSTTNLATTTATFSFVAGGASPLTNKWYKGNTLLGNGASPSGSGATISGSSSSVLTISGVLKADADTYTIVVTNALGAVTNSATLTVVDPAVLTSPSHQTNGVGANITFTASGGGTSPLTFSWQHGTTTLIDDGIHIIGSTTGSLQLNNITSTDAGSYTFVASNNFGAITSSFARLVVTVPATVSTPPTGQTINAGSLLTLTAAASGSPTPTTRWERNGVTITNCTACTASGSGISGATGGTLRITNVLGVESGSYTFVASNSTGIQTSAPALVTIIDPGITLQPIDTGAPLGGSAILSVQATGAGTLTYQWQKNNNNVSGGNITGATTTNLTVSNISSTDYGSYRVLVTGSAGTTTSSTAMLLQTGANGELAISNVTYSQNFDGIGSSATATLPVGWIMSPDAGVSSPVYTSGTNLTSAAASSGAPTAGARYNWGDGNNPSDRAIGFMTSSGYHSPNSIMLGLYNNTGSNITSLALSFNYERYRTQPTATFPTVNFSTSTDGINWTANTTGDITYDTNANTYFFTAVQQSNRAFTVSTPSFAPGNYYYLRWAFNTANSTSEGLGLDDFSLSATVTQFIPTPPTISSQPAPATIWQGSNVTFSVTASGTGPFSYQWYKNVNNALLNKTNSTLTLTNVQPTDAGTYTVVVTNLGGPITSDGTSTLTVLQPVTATIAQVRAAVDNTTWVTTADTNIYKVTGIVTTYTNTVTGANTLFAMQDNSGAGIWVFLSKIAATINAGDQVQVIAPLTTFNGRLELQVTSTNASTGYTVLSTGNAVPTSSVMSWTTLTNFTANDAFEGSRVAIGPVFMDLRTNTFATNSTLTVTNTGDLTQTFAVRVDQHCADFQGQTKPTICYLVGSMDQSTTNIAPTNGYQLAITTFADVAFVPPSITLQPQSVNVNYGGTANFNSFALGGHMQYAWKKGNNALSNGGHISGATTTNLTVSSAAAADAGSYTLTYVVPSDISGASQTSQDSQTVILSVNDPLITSQPQNTTVTCASGGCLSVSATGSGTLSYQWYKPNPSGTPVGGNSNTLCFAGNDQTAAGSYSVVVTGTGGSITSAVAVVSVDYCGTAPSITIQPQPSTVRVGSNAVFTVTGSSDPAPAYQWYFGNTQLSNGAHYSGTTSSALTILSSIDADTGSYSVVLSNHLTGAISGSTLTSSTATLFVVTPVAITGGITTSGLTVKIPDGTNVSFSVVATGTDPKTYKWYVKDFGVSGDGTLVATTTTSNAVISAKAVNRAQVYSTNLYYVVIDNAANLPASNGLATVSITVDGKTPSPVVVSLPKKNHAYNAAGFSISGTASDKPKGNIASVHYKYINQNFVTQVESDVFTAPIVEKTPGNELNKIFNITTNPPPLPGTNTLVIWTDDLGGNSTSNAPTMVQFFYEVPIAFALNRGGDGSGAIKYKGTWKDAGTIPFSVNPTNSSVQLNVGEVYTFTFIPDKKANTVTGTAVSVLTNAPPAWGNTNYSSKYLYTTRVQSNNNSLSFEFDRDRFVDMQGKYNAVFTANTNSPTIASSGYLNLGVTSKRIGSGALTMGTAAKTPFAGIPFDASGHTHFSVGSITIDGNLAWTGSENTGPKQFIGTATDGTWTAKIIADLADKTFVTATANATMEIPAVAGGPAGTGRAAITAAGGNVKAIYTLADDDKHPLTWGLFGSRSGNVPQYIVTKTGSLLLGTLHVSADAQTISATRLTWIGANPNAIYPTLNAGGFTASPFDAVCSPFAIANKSFAGNFHLTLNGGGVVSNVVNQAVTFANGVLAPVGAIKSGAVDGFGNIKIVFQDGRVSGKTKLTTTALGTWLPNANNGAGFFILSTSPANSGTMTLAP